MNKANSDKHPLTATCGANSNKKKKKKKRNKSEVWQMHCDLNENGKVDDDEIAEKVKVTSKKGTCKVKNAPQIKCQKRQEKCSCESVAEQIKDEMSDFRAGVSPVFTCIQGSDKRDTFLVEASKNGKMCQNGKEITVNTDVCDRKLRSIVKSVLKKANC